MSKQPNEGDLRVWHIPQIPMKPFYWRVDTPKHAKDMLDMLAQYDLFQYRNNIKPDYSNASGLQVFEDGEWSDWYNEDGDGIDDVYFDEVQQ